MEEKRFGRLVFLPGKSNGRYPFCNSLYIDDEIKAVIDTACDESVLKRIYGFQITLQSEGLTTKSLQKILLDMKKI